jgi:hypothetical protein
VMRHDVLLILVLRPILVRHGVTPFSS